jgi:putative heme iron utilization protein
MAASSNSALRSLLESQAIAALGTLHRGEPYVSMVPFALDEEGPDFLIHVSALAPHTKDMLDSPRVSLLIVAPESSDVAPQARARATIQGDALPIERESDAYSRGKARYLSRFPQAEEIFLLPDFSLFRVRTRSVRFIAGFAQAASLTRETFAGALRDA